MAHYDKATISSKLLSADQVACIYHANLKPEPYVLKFGDLQQKFTFIGSHHTNNPDHPQFGIILKAWEEFKIDLVEQNAIVLSEGGVRDPAASASEAIEAGGEAGLLRFLADDAGLQIDSPEPPRNQEANELAKRYGRDAVICYYFVRQIPQWHRQLGSKPALRNYLERTLNMYKKKLEWSGFDFDYDSVVRTCEQLSARQFREEDGEFYHEQSDPTKTNTTIQAVARACSRYRNEYIALRLLDLWSEGKSIFSVYGSAHVYTIEPVLVQKLPEFKSA